MDSAIPRSHSRIPNAAREFFPSRGYLETDTSHLCPELIPEPSLEAHFFPCSRVVELESL